MLHYIYTDKLLRFNLMWWYISSYLQNRHLKIPNNVRFTPKVTCFFGPLLCTIE